jgi:hypothetical protein
VAKWHRFSLLMRGLRVRVPSWVKIVDVEFVIVLEMCLKGMKLETKDSESEVSCIE